MEAWIIFAVLLVIIEHTMSEDNSFEDILDEPPLTKSLGFSIRKDLDSKTLEDARLNKEFMYQYQEMLKASKETFENVDSKEEKRLRRVVGDQNYQIIKEAGVLDRRRNTSRFDSPVGKRRARTQALRRQKLNSQCLKSHQQHAKYTTPDYTSY